MSSDCGSGNPKPQRRMVGDRGVRLLPGEVAISDLGEVFDFRDRHAGSVDVLTSTAISHPPPNRCAVGANSRIDFGGPCGPVGVAF